MNKPQPVIVRAGELEPQDAFGMSLTLLTVGAQSAGQWLLLEYLAPPRCPGPPSHRHKMTTEVFYILDGTLTVSVDKQVVHLAPGSCAYLPPGITHTFANESDAPTRFLLISSPAGLEQYYAELDQLRSDEPGWPPGDSGEMISLMEKYDTFPPLDDAIYVGG